MPTARYDCLVVVLSTNAYEMMVVGGTIKNLTNTDVVELLPVELLPV